MSTKNSLSLVSEKENLKQQKVSDYIFDFVSTLGVKDVFYLPGGGCMHLVDSLGRNKSLNQISCLHEQAAAIAADAYSQYTNNIGVALVTTGPGSTNTITGVAGSWIDSIPLLIISGQVKTADMIKNSGLRQLGVQEIDIISIVKPITKYAVTIEDPKKIRYHLEKAVYIATTSRPGPVWIDVPLDVQGAIIEGKLDAFESPGANPQSNLSNQVAKVIDFLNQAERPVILAGNGIRLSKSLDEFKKLLDVLNIPVLNTWKAIDFLPEDHTLYFGRPGFVGQRGANFIQQNSDLIITIGARLDFGQTAYNHRNFARAAKKVIVDIDQAEINKLQMKIDVAIESNAKVFINEMLKQQPKIQSNERSSWLNRCRQWKEKYPVVLEDYWRKESLVNIYVLVDALSQVMAKTDSKLLVPGSSGGCSEVTLQAFKVGKDQRIINNPGLGAMGFGLPASIGACIASGNQTTISIISDGGFQLNIQELETVKRLNLPIKFFILNNGGYASIKTTQNNYFDGNLVGCDPSSGLTMPDTLRISNAYKIRSSAIRDQKNITDKLEKIIAGDGPHICEVFIDPEQKTQPKLTSQIKEDGSIVSKPLEDLWPFLGRDEFLENMIIPPLDE